MLKPETEAALATMLGSFWGDPYGYVMAVYPWGEPTLPDGSPNPLRNKKGPEKWQKRLLIRLGNHIRENAEVQNLGLDRFVWRSARASGHGIGKSAIVAWLIHFFMGSRHNTRGIVTANTQKQLEDKTWPELSKWHNMFIAKHWFTWTATSYYFNKYSEEKRKNYMVTAMTVSDENTEAFAGLHNEEGTVFIIFDEASGISSKVWEVADGATTDGEGFFFSFGNPTRPDGPFFDCFTKYADLFDLENIDSREVTHTNKQAISDIIRKYGEDSDEVKVRVRGVFPTQSFNGFISAEAVLLGQTRRLDRDDGEALIMAVDVARMGNDSSIVRFRQGRDARSIAPLKFDKKDGWELAAEVANIYRKYQPDALVVDATGVGSGPVDILRKFYKIPVKEIHVGVPGPNFRYYVNLRAELWADMRDALLDNLCIDDDAELKAQLLSVTYFLDKTESKTQLISKKQMLEEGKPSPDDADALALTFAVKLPRRDIKKRRQADGANSREDAITEYDPVNY